MVNVLAAVTLVSVAITAQASAQTRKPASARSIKYDVTIKTDSVYTGTMEMAVDRGKVSGTMLLTSPTEITGKVAGTAKGSVLALDFPYFMKERGCEGNVKMDITLPAKPGPATGTMEAVGCGRDPGNKLGGTVELVPVSLKKK